MTGHPHVQHRPHHDVGWTTAACDLRMHVGAPREMLFPAHVAHGDGLIEQSGELIARWGVSAATVFVVSDRFLAESGLLDPLLESLGRSGWRIEAFTDVAGEPTVALAEEVVEAARASAAELVVGLGGGSALDLAKVAALLLSNPGDAVSDVGSSGDPRPATPLVLIPTTAGTGAEATRVAVLSDGRGKRVVGHDSLVPLGVILDAGPLIGLPPSVTASTGMDALAHAIESSFSTSSTPLTASMGLRAAELLVHWLPVAYRDPGNLTARRGTLYGAFLAGVALNAGVVLGHSMAYTVANRTGLAHGVTCAMALPYCIAFNAPALGPDLEAFALLLTEGASRELAVAAETVAELAHSFEIPATPPAAGIDGSEAVPMARECASAYPRPTNPVPMTVDRLEHLYAAWFRGDLRGAGSG